MDQHPAAVDLAQRALVVRLEGGERAGADLGDVARGVDLVGEADHRAEPACRRRRRDAHRAQAGAAVSWALGIASVLLLAAMGRRFWGRGVGVLAALFLATYVVENLSAGTWYFAVKAYTTAGVESDNSNIASKTIG